tara:strand:- start:28488 stop:29819 length:1332 start_codon:yes stop_codon:yes gene_type:complete
MSYILLPKVLNNFFFFNFKFNNKYSYQDKDSVYISKSLNLYLNYIKLNIDNYNKEWDIFKKYTNPYEYIHSSVNELKFSVCNYKPLSRSFYKMIEIINTFNLLDETNPIFSFHLAEGPGGFIQAFCHTRENIHDKYFGMTLESSDRNIPGWKKSYQFLNENPNVKIITGHSKNGDLFNKNNLVYIRDNYKNKCNYVTGDGGIDFSVDFNNQEYLSSRLLLAQIFYNMIIQKVGGCFVLKIFDIFSKLTVDMLFTLSCLYENVYLYKPNTSRIANSEKYIICKNYKGVSDKLIEYIINNFDNILNNIDSISSLFDCDIPNYFINRIEEVNAIYGQTQIENINFTLNIIRENNIVDISNNFINKSRVLNKLNNLKLNNIIKSINWCKKNNLLINKHFIDYTNSNSRTNSNTTITDNSNNNTNNTIIENSNDNGSSIDISPVYLEE